MAVNFLINSEVSLFDMTIGVPLWLQYISISEIKWLKGNPINGVKAIVTFCEYLKDDAFLLRLSEEARLIFDLNRWEYGLKDTYDPSMVIARFTNCEVLNKWIEDLVATDPGSQSVVFVFVQMRVEFKMFPLGVK